MIGFSIIICTYNGEAVIFNTLKHILALKRTSEFNIEVIVVDNNSNDNTYHVVNSILSSQSIFKYKILKESLIGKAFAFKTAVLNSSYKYILICDDDNWLKEDYLINAFRRLNSNHNIGALGGYGEVKCEVIAPAWFSVFQDHYATGSQEASAIAGELYGAGMIVPLKLLRKIYESEDDIFLLTGRAGKLMLSSEDTELTLMIRLLGFSVVYDDSLHFIHFIKKEKLNKLYLYQLFYGFGLSVPFISIYRFIEGGKNNPRMYLLIQWLKAFFRLAYFFILPPKPLGRLPYFYWCVGNLNALWKINNKFVTMCRIQGERINSIKKII
jgi:glycosyltransferase involved in cell wall biosynthesis